jgi:hypothetical protein
LYGGGAAMNKFFKDYLIGITAVVAAILCVAVIFLLAEVKDLRATISTIGGQEIIDIGQNDNAYMLLSDLKRENAILQEEVANLNFEVFDEGSFSYEWNSLTNSRMDVVERHIDLYGDSSNNRVVDIMNLEAEVCRIFTALGLEQETIYCMPWYDGERIRYDRIEFDMEDLDTVQELIVTLDTAISKSEDMDREFEDLFFKVWYMWEELYLFDNDFTDTPENDDDPNNMSFTDFTMYGFTSTSNMETMVDDGWRDEPSRLDQLFSDMYSSGPTPESDYNNSTDWNFTDGYLAILEARIKTLEEAQ